MELSTSLGSFSVWSASLVVGLLPFKVRGSAGFLSSKCWSLLTAGTICSGSFLFACCQVADAARSSSKSTRSTEIMYTCLELLKNLLYSSSLLLHAHASVKHSLLFKSVIARTASLGSLSRCSCHVAIGAALNLTRSFCLVYSLVNSTVQIDIYVLRSNIVIDVMVWLNYLILLQMISLLNTVNRFFFYWRRHSSFYVLNVNRHVYVMKLSQKIMFLYSRQMFGVTAQCVYAATMSCYYITTNAMKTSSELTFWFHTIDVLSFSVSSYQLFVAAHTCELINSNMERFYNDLFQLMRASRFLCSNKKLRLYLSVRRTVNFTACGLFKLGYPLITSVIAAAATYLVILVQFSMPE